MRKKDNYIECVNILHLLKKEYPSLCLAQHIYGALADYGDFWGMTDKEFLFAFNKYMTELEFSLEKETSIDKIIADASNKKLFQFEEDEYGDE